MLDSSHKNVIYAPSFCSKPICPYSSVEHKGGILKNILAAFFHIMKVNRNWGCQVQKMTKKKAIAVVHMTRTIYSRCSEVIQVLSEKQIEMSLFPPS